MNKVGWIMVECETGKVSIFTLFFIAFLEAILFGVIYAALERMGLTPWIGVSKMVEVGITFAESILIFFVAIILIAFIVNVLSYGIIQYIKRKKCGC